jgi:hypothetical protein
MARHHPFSFRPTASSDGGRTDQLGGFVPEAMRLMDGGPLAIESHPPFYPIVVAAVYCTTGDGMAS